MNADKQSWFYPRLSAFICGHFFFLISHIRTVCPKPEHRRSRKSLIIRNYPRHIACSSLSRGRYCHGTEGTHSGNFGRLAHAGTSGGACRVRLETVGDRVGARGGQYAGGRAGAGDRGDPLRAARGRRLLRAGGEPVRAADHRHLARYDRGRLSAFRGGRRTQPPRPHHSRGETLDAVGAVRPAAAHDPGGASGVFQRGVDPEEAAAAAGGVKYSAKRDTLTPMTSRRTAVFVVAAALSACLLSAQTAPGIT